MNKWLCLPLLLLCGCTTDYWNDRGNDVMDIFTFTGGTGFGAAFRGGPLHAGLGFYDEGCGLRGGCIGQKGELVSATVPVKEGLKNYRNETVKKYTYPVGVTGEYTFGYSEDFYAGRTANKSFVSADNPDLIFYGYPLFCGAACPMENQDEVPFLLPYYTQFDVMGAGLFGFRFGLNPGEMLDFLFGFTTLDIYLDDSPVGGMWVPNPQPKGESREEMICIPGGACFTPPPSTSDSALKLTMPNSSKMEAYQKVYETVR